MMKLFTEHTPEDLACRGFGQEEILAMTGVDTGYHTNALRGVTQGIDRMTYKVEHVKQRVSQDVIDDVLQKYAVCDLDAAGVLDGLGLANPTLCKLRRLFNELGMSDEFKQADKEHRKSNMASGMVTKYGVDNPFKMDNFQKKAASTREERYGAAYTLASGSALADRARETFSEHMQDEVFREDLQARKSAACMERYGVEHPMQNDEIKAKTVATRVKNSRERYFAQKKRRYGRKKSDFVRESHYVFGNRYDYSQTKFVDMQTKVTVICSEHGPFSVMPTKHLSGSGCPYCAGNVQKTTEQFIDDARQVHGERYDYSKTNYVRAFDKVCIICPEHGEFWQVAHDHLQGSGCPKCWKIKACDTSLAKYGTEHPMQSESVQAKSRQTNELRLGVPFTGQSLECRKKAIRTNIERYGVSNPMSNADVHRKCEISRRKNGTFNTSQGEDALYGWLCELFGADDVERQYSSDARYPYNCDFYVRSRDMFIELNGIWTHGPHWFGSDSVMDNEILAYWEKHAGRMYDSACHTWMVSDVAKRDAARKHSLNYIVFWDGSAAMMDMRLWFAMGCPDGCDWNCEYSWLPNRDIDDITISLPDIAAKSFATRVARWANWRIFYHRELSLWIDNAYQKNWGTLQAQLYANRYKYLRSGVKGNGLYQGKLPDELSGLEILRGLGIMGKIKAYTTFDNTAMVAVIDKYDIKSVIDPCAGWGERIATCIANGINYYGIDINDKLCDGYARIIEHYGDERKHRFVCGDAATIAVDTDADAVITCPPYGNIEIYSESGAENFDGDAFAKWWCEVVKNIGTHAKKYFCVQTNQACKSVFRDGLEQNGWHYVESIELARRSSHMTRRGGKNVKREYEEMMVFERGSADEE